MRIQFDRQTGILRLPNGSPLLPIEWVANDKLLVTLDAFPALPEGANGTMWLTPAAGGEPIQIACGMVGEPIVATIPEAGAYALNVRVCWASFRRSALAVAVNVRQEIIPNQ